jgi:hypothetical protein
MVFDAETQLAYCHIFANCTLVPHFVDEMSFAAFALKPSIIFLHSVIQTLTCASRDSPSLFSLDVFLCSISFPLLEVPLILPEFINSIRPPISSTQGTLKGLTTRLVVLEAPH